MFLPIGDDNSDRRLTPIINYLFILANIFVFIYFQHWGRNLHFVAAYATVPAELLTGHDIVTDSQLLQDPYTGQTVEMPGLQATPIPVYLTLLTSMFMHGGFAHIAGNMLYLWIFGDNLENVMGHRNYFFFYILCGVLAGLSHTFSTVYFYQNPLVPSLGASGAISGVLGGYILLFPVRRIHVWVLWLIISLPAFIVVGLWFVFQIIDGMGMLGGNDAGGVAYGAHVGGFVAGLVLVKLFVQRDQMIPPKRRRSYW